MSIGGHITPYSQKNPTWANLTYYGNYTFKNYGCFVVSLSMLIDKEPPATADILKNNGCFDSKGYLISECASSALGIEYNGKSNTRPDYDCICETDFYKGSGYPQHFFVLLKNGMIIDPLIQPALETTNHYENNIISYRLFKARGETMTPKERFINFVASMYQYMRGKDPSSAELKQWVDRITADFNGSNPNNALSDAVWGFFKAPEWKGSVESRNCSPCPDPTACEPCEPCPPCPKPPCPDLDILTPWELIKLAINRWLKL